MKSSALAALLLCAVLPLSGCVVFGASSSGGWFIFPGGLGLVLLVLFVLAMLRRR